MTARARQMLATVSGAAVAADGAVWPSLLACWLACWLAGGLTACATTPPPGRASHPATPAPTVTPAATPQRTGPAPARPQPTPPTPVRPSFLCGPADPEWEEWFDQMFGGLARTVPLTLDPRRLQELIEPAQVEAEAMLRRGLQACDPLAVVVIDRAGWRQLMPELSATVGANSAAFGLQAVVTLRKFGDMSDHSDIVVAALTADSAEDRASAAEGARFFSLAPLREPLLDRVRRDPAWEVRFHAAESLLDLADVYPRDLADHPAVEAALRGQPATAAPSRPGDSVPSAGDEGPFADGAAALDQLITARLAAGPCPPPRPLDRPRIRAIAVREALMALTVESRIGACERQLGFVVFIPSAGGYGSPPFAAPAPPDGRPLTFQTRPFPLAVDYRPRETTLRVGTVRLNLQEANVAVVVAAGPQATVLRYRAAQELGFARSGRPDPAVPSMLRFDDELAAAVRNVLDRSPDLAAFVNK